MTSQSDSVTLVISRRIKQGQKEAYDDWLQRLIQTIKLFPGYMGITTLSPEGIDSDIRYVIVRFDNESNLNNWEKSDARNILVDEVTNYTTQYYVRATGMETWFSLPNMKTVKAPPKWKMFLVTLMSAYIISLIVHLLFAQYMDSWPLFESNFVYVSILVAILTYFAMPRLSVLLRRWLYPKQNDL